MVNLAVEPPAPADAAPLPAVSLVQLIKADKVKIAIKIKAEEQRNYKI